MDTLLKKRIVLAVAAFFLFILLSNNLVSLFLAKKDENQARKTPAKETLTAAQNPAMEITAKKRYPLTPEDPAKYGIVSYSAADQPRNQAQWDIFMEKALVKSGLLEQKNAKPAIEKMKTTPEEFQARMKEIDDRIVLFEQKKAANPSDADAQENLQRLYMLKAMAQAMEKKVTAP